LSLPLAYFSFLGEIETMPLTIEQIFDESYYLNLNPEAAQAVANGEFSTGLEHFQAVGADSGLRFTPLLDVGYYKNVANPQLRQLSNRDALNDLLDRGIDNNLLFSPHIDLNYYQSTNGLSFATNSEALLDLRDVGLNAGRAFSPHVNLPEFQAFNPTLATKSLADAFTELATYGTPLEEGRIRIPLGKDAGFTSVPDEYELNGSVKDVEGEIIYTYSKSQDRVTLEYNFSGLPYQLDLTRPEDVSNAYNQQPISVEDGVWQFWIVPRWFSVPTNYWYDGKTNRLIGNEYDRRFFTDAPATNENIDVNGDGIADIARSIPSIQMIESQLFEANPDGTGSFTFTTECDRMLDYRGTGGTYVGVLPYQLGDPSTVGIYYTEGGIDPSLAMSCDTIVEELRQGLTSFNFAISLEPNPKPSYLFGRDNTMLGPTAIYPNRVPPGIVHEPALNLYRPATIEDLVNHANEAWPGRIFVEANSIPEPGLNFSLLLLAIVMLGIHRRFKNEQSS
jgi:hypothetical protein